MGGEGRDHRKSRPNRKSDRASPPLRNPYKQQSRRSFALFEIVIVSNGVLSAYFGGDAPIEEKNSQSIFLYSLEF